MTAGRHILFSRTGGYILAGVSLFAGILLLMTAALGGALAAAQISGQTISADRETSALQLVREASANELAANDGSSKHLFRSRKQTPHGSQTRLYVETSQATAALTIAHDDKLLSADELKDEQDKLNAMASSPEQLNHKHAQEAENAQRSKAILKALPEAFLYQPESEVMANQAAGGTGRKLVRLKFRPNPAYQPPSQVERVLLGMQGTLEIDPAAKRIAEIDGTLFKEVSFGWGILGRLDPGGHFLVNQRDVGNGEWEISRLSLIFTGKIMLFKTLSINTDEVFGHFTRVPDNTNFAQGMAILKAEEAKLAQMHSTAIDIDIDMDKVRRSQ